MLPHWFVSYCYRLEAAYVAIHSKQHTIYSQLDLTHVHITQTQIDCTINDIIKISNHMIWSYNTAPFYKEYDPY